MTDSSAGRHRVVELPPDPSSPARARRFVEEALGACPAEIVETATLLVSELVTNVVLHAGTPMWVSVDRVGADAGVRVTVADAARNLPVGIAAQPHGAEPGRHGRGLLLVERMARRWGVDRLATGKTVWFELGRGRSPVRAYSVG